MQIEVSEDDIELARNLYKAILNEDYFCTCPENLVFVPELQVYKNIIEQRISYTTSRIKATLYLAHKLTNAA